MPVNFPTSLDTNPSAATLAAQDLDDSPHSTLHGDLGDQIEALEAKVGIDGSAVTTSHDYKFSQLAATYQPLDSDLTAIAALSTTAYGRAFLALANQAATMALLSAASDTSSGIVELATSAETVTGTDTARAVTPASAAAAYQPLDSDLTAIAALSTTSFGRSVLAAADAAALQTLAGTVIGTNVQAYDADLAAIAGLTATSDSFIQAKSSAWAARTVAQVKTDLGLTGTNSGDQTITLTGDVTGSGTGSFAATIATGAVGPTQLAATAVTPGSYGTSSLVPSFTVDADGRITAASSNAIADSPSILVLARAYFK